MTEVKVRVEAVRVEGRHRKDLGDIKSLAESIERDGLIHAIAVTPDLRLLVGERRLAAYQLLGRDMIDARVVDYLDDAVARLRVERDENTERKPMTPSELVALGRALEALERPRALARQAASTSKAGRARHGVESASSSDDQDAGPAAQTRQVVASALGMSESSYQRARTVVEAANDPAASPEEKKIAQEALADMDSGETTISGAHTRIVEQVKARVGARKAPTIESAAVQRRALTSAATALSGISHGLKQIVELHPDITSEEAALWVDGLSESRRVIESLIKRLKERTNAQG